MLQLALGLLPDRAAGEAEVVRRQCDHCSRWWHEHLEGQPGSGVDQGVAQAFASFRAPAQQRFGKWLPLAAAAVLALAVGLVLRSSDPQSAEDASLARDEILVQETWENAFEDASTLSMTVGGTAVVDSRGRSLDETGEEPELLFAEDLESADLSNWSSSG